MLTVKALLPQCFPSPYLQAVGSPAPLRSSPLLVSSLLLSSLLSVFPRLNSHYRLQEEEEVLEEHPEEVVTPGKTSMNNKEEEEVMSEYSNQSELLI